MKLLALSIASTALLAGCIDIGSSQKLEACWAPNTKQTIGGFAQSIAVEFIESEVSKKNGDPLTPEKKADIASRTKVVTSDYRVLNFNKDSERLSCATKVVFTFTRPDNEQLNGDTEAEFEISKSEGGSYFSMPKAPIIGMVTAAAAKK